MDRFTGERLVVEGMDEPAIASFQFFDGIAYELYGEQLRQTIEILPIGGPAPPGLAHRELKNAGFSTSLVYTFTVEEETRSILMRPWSPAPGAIPVSWESGQAMVTGPVPGDRITEIHGCGVRFHRQGSSFVGTPVDAPCLSTTEHGVVRVETRWKVTPQQIRMNQSASIDEGPGSTVVRLSSVHRCQYFDARLYNLEQVAFSNNAGTPWKRIHDQNGSATFGPVSVSDETLSDPFGIGCPRFVVSLDRAGDHRILRGSRWHSKTSSEPAIQIEIPMDTEDFAFELGDARFELRLAQPILSGANEIVEWFQGSFSNLAHKDKLEPEIKLHVEPVWANRDGGPWFYLEMVYADIPDEPILQRIVSIQGTGDPWTKRVLIETLDDPTVAVGAWRDPQRFESLKGRVRTLPDPCKLFLHKRGNAWVGFSTKLCGADPIESLTWRLTHDRFDLKRSAISPTGSYLYPYHIVRVDRIPTEEAEP
jgi:hypothetical protein